MLLIANHWLMVPVRYSVVQMSFPYANSAKKVTNHFFFLSSYFKAWINYLHLRKASYYLCGVSNPTPHSAPRAHCMSWLYDYILLCDFLEDRNSVSSAHVQQALTWTSEWVSEWMSEWACALRMLRPPLQRSQVWGRAITGYSVLSSRRS